MKLFAIYCLENMSTAISLEEKKMEQVIKSHCAGFGWDRVNFLHTSWYETIFWICAENSVDHTGMFRLLLSSTYT